MPQMAPISWLILFIMFSMAFMMFNVMNYFSYLPPTPNMTKSQQYMTKSQTWKW